MNLLCGWPTGPGGARWSACVTALCAFALLHPLGPVAAEQDEPRQESPQTAPQTKPAADAPAGTWMPQTKFTSRREMMRQWLIDQGKDPDELMKPKIRYEKGSFMITGSLEIDPSLYDGKALVDRWIEQIEPRWKERLPLTAKVGNPGRVTFRIVTTRKDGVYRLEIVEPSGLDSFDEAARETMEEAKPLFVVPEDYPAEWTAFYLKFHYNMFSEL